MKGLMKEWFELLDTASIEALTVWRLSVYLCVCVRYLAPEPQWIAVCSALLPGAFFLFLFFTAADDS